MKKLLYPFTHYYSDSLCRNNRVCHVVESGEFQIAKRMEERTLQLKGAKAELRNLHPKIVLDTINLTSDEMADAVALIDGKITEVYVEKNSYVNRGNVIFSVVNESIPLTN